MGDPIDLDDVSAALGVDADQAVPVCRDEVQDLQPLDARVLLAFFNGNRAWTNVKAAKPD